MTVQEAQVDDLHETGEEEFVDELTPGTQLMHGQYTIESFLNSGGFGITYLARDSLDRLVVIKECFPGSFCRRQNASVVARSRAHQAELRSIVRLFTQEARSLAKAGHPNVVGVHQVFEDNGTAYMALDYVEGMDLLEIITETPGVLTPTQIRGYLTKMLDAISFVHKQGILHRDISPDNILVRADNEPVLIDFGAAREEASKQSRLLSALRVVKDGYSPQEFYVAGSEQSNSCDLYSLAASFYHIITGDLPPDSQTRLAAAAAGDADPFVPLGQRTNDYDEVFCTSLDKAMSVLPRERIQTAEDWLAMLNGEAVSEAPKSKSRTQSRVTKRPASAAKVQPATAAKSKLPILLGSTAAVLGIAAVGYFASQGGSDETSAALDTPAAIDAPFVIGTQPPLNEAAPAPVAEPAPLSLEPEAPVVEQAEAPSAPAITEPAADAQPTLSVTVQAPTGATQQSVPPTVGSADSGVEIASAPGLEAATSEAPFVNQSEPASPPPAEPAPMTLDSLPAGVELVTPEPATPEVTANALPEGVELIVPETATPEPSATQLPEGVELIVPETSAPALSADQLPAGVELVTPEPSVTELPAGVELVTPEPSATELPAGVELITPSTPELPAGVELITPEASNVTLQSTPTDSTGIISDVTVGDLPFTLSSRDPGVVETVLSGAPFWLARGTRILTIEGQPVTSTEQANALAQASIQDAGNTSFQLAVTTEAQVSGAAIDRVLTMPVVRTTTLLNGMEFETRLAEDDVWSTTVTAVPDGSTIQLGDQVVAFITTSELIQGPDTLREVISRELQAGRTDFSFAIRRDGQIWVETITLKS